MTKRIRSIFVFTGLATSLLLLAIYPPTRSVIKTVLWGVAWAALLSPLCAVFEGFLKRGWAVALAVLSSFLFIGVLIALLLPPVIAQSVALSAQMPQILLGVQQLIERGQAFLSGYGIQLSGGGQFIAQRLSGIGAQLAQSAWHQTGALMDGLSRMLIALVLAIYFLKDREAFGYRLSMCIPLRYRKRFLAATSQMKRELFQYLKGQFTVSLFVGVMTAFLLWLLRVPYYLLLGLAMGILDIIPYYGPVLGTIPVLLFSVDMGFQHMLLALLAVVLVQQVEANLLSPRIMGSSTGVHPVAVILLLTLGSSVGGIRGMLLALPAFLAARGFLHAVRYYPG
ncbi:AI-2E family transporter [Beduinella massiliensis]|uniref:AI-2E family transporter n=1 Tax=Beduinella massiliensis TaxID=1852363 RepID=UPI0031F772CE